MVCVTSICGDIRWLGTRRDGCGLGNVCMQLRLVPLVEGVISVVSSLALLKDVFIPKCEEVCVCVCGV